MTIKDVPDFPGYRISYEGLVWTCRVFRRPARLGVEWRPHKTCSSNPGYRHTVLWRDGLRCTRLIHRLVLEAFIGPCPDGMVGCHNNGDPTDNRLDNLRWDTMVGNMADRVLHGTACRGEQHPLAKLTNRKIMDIRRRAARGEEVRIIARKLKVDRLTVDHVVKRRTWRHLP